MAVMARSKPSPKDAPGRITKERSLWRDAMRRLLRNRLSVVGLLIVLVFLVAAIFGPYLTPYDFLEQNLTEALQGPSARHWLGTDPQGRDIFSRLLYGARTAALVAVSTTTISLVIGVTLGTMAGFLGRRVDGLIMWVTDITMAIPGILMAMLISTSIKRPVAAWFDAQYQATRNPFFLNTLWLDFVLVFGALALISWPGYARLIRSQVLSLQKTMYVEAAEAIGCSKPWIMLRHIVPNAMGPIIVSVTQGIGAAILLESSLSFLGIGVQPPNASWGSMLSSSLTLWRTYPHLMAVPAITIGIIQIGFIFLGDGLNDALNPRQRT